MRRDTFYVTRPKASGTGVDTVSKLAPDQAAAIITAAVPDRAAPIVVYCWDPG